MATFIKSVVFAQPFSALCGAAPEAEKMLALQACCLKIFLLVELTNLYVAKAITLTQNGACQIGLPTLPLRHL
jgi:hypothetical protein